VTHQLRARRRNSTQTGGARPSTSSSSGLKTSTPGPLRMMSPPGPPRVSAATVNSHVDSGSTASRADFAHWPAAQTRAAFVRPLINPLIGNGMEPIKAGSSRAPAMAERTPSTASSVRTTVRNMTSARPVVEIPAICPAFGLVAVRWGRCQVGQRANRLPTGSCLIGPASAAGCSPDPGPYQSLPVSCQCLLLTSAI
jgi:hypothetical protein